MDSCDGTASITVDGYEADAYYSDGNLTNDGVHWYTYDAESRIIAVDGGSTATYV